MLTAILVLAVLAVLLSSLGAVLASAALVWAKEDGGWLATEILKTQAKHTSLLEAHAETLARVDENLLVVNDTANVIEAHAIEQAKFRQTVDEVPA